MVLAELGSEINAAFSRMSKNTTVSDEVIDALLGDIARALLMADVNVRLVKDFRTAVKTQVMLEADEKTNNMGKYVFVFGNWPVGLLASSSGDSARSQFHSIRGL
eukprot:gene22908-35111_t